MNLRSHFRSRAFIEDAHPQKKIATGLFGKKNRLLTIFKKKKPCRDYIRLGREKGLVRGREKAPGRPVYVCMYVNVNMCICIFVCMYVSIYA